MALDKGIPFMTKKAKAKMESDKKRAEEERRRQDEEARREEERARELQNSKGDPPLVLNLKIGRQNGHNW